MRRFLVTGAEGFLGSHVVESLVADGLAVRALDDGSGAGARSLPGVEEEIERIRADVRDAKALERAVEGVDCVIHLAARGAADGGLAEPLEGHAVNAAGSLALLEAARRAGVRRVVQASSWRVYGVRSPQPLAETREPRPASPYGVQKLCGEVYAGLYHRLHGLETVCLRYFPLFGPRQRPEGGYAAGVLARAAALARGETPPPALPALEAATDLLFVADAVRATRLAAAAAGAAGAVLNVGSGRAAAADGALPGTSDGVLPAVADVSGARARLGFEAATSLEEGLARTVAWLRGSGVGSVERKGVGTGREGEEQR